MSDLSNGNSQALDPKRWLYVNPDTTLYIHRLPDGEWIGMRSWVDQVSTGIGVNESAVYDLKGRFGHINQAQLLERRCGRARDGAAGVRRPAAGGRLEAGSWGHRTGLGRHEPRGVRRLRPPGTRDWH